MKSVQNSKKNSTFADESAKRIGGCVGGSHPSRQAPAKIDKKLQIEQFSTTIMRARTLLASALAVLLLALPAARAAASAPGIGVVVLDAGHGGRFPGAHYGGVYEKDLTLKVALKLGAMIEAEMPGVEVVYTRKSDKALAADLAGDLQARADIANRAEGDLFLSIHVNASRSTAAYGVETLVMGESPKETRYNENALFENNRDDLIDMSDERTAAIVRAYIQNLQFTYGQYSQALARCIQNSYVRAGRHSRGVKPQLLRVLYATDMPSVLTEIGFLSNAKEAAYLKSEKGQTEIARALLRAVKEYSDYVARCRAAEEGEEAALPDAGQDEAADAGKASGKSAGETAAPQGGKQASGAKEAGKQKAEAAGAKPDGKQPAAKQGGKRAPVRYAVQVLASSKPVALGSAQFGPYRGKVKQYRLEGRLSYKYCVGDYAARDEAQRQLKSVRRSFPDAFVVGCRDGRIVNEK